MTSSQKNDSNHLSKEILLEKLQETLRTIRLALEPKFKETNGTIHKPAKEVNQLKKEDREHFRHLQFLASLRLEELKTIEKSPFFARCLIEHQSVDARLAKPRDIYFGKYEFSEQGIYSWVAPIAAIRFETPGVAKFKLPNGRTREVIIHEKDQYMIVDGKVMFYSRETETEPRRLIYQEHFSIKNGVFMLPEIVEIMEKAQDDVIRASHFGPFAISGPAGSGKTTLALHRVAYLVQSPETSPLYTKDSVIVFVQDSSTKEYFSHLLPELGIHDVNITTFFEWAREVLRLEDVTFKNNTEYEFEKLTILQKLSESLSWKGNAFATLTSVYSLLGSNELNKEFKKQRSMGCFDRIDITIALMLFKKRYGKLEIHTETNRVMRMGRIVRRKQKTTLSYSLAVVDEFQNYMPAQLELIKSCLKEETQSVVYVGDLSQIVQHGTVNSWDQFGESIEEKRQIKLHKVYRNTKEILNYINGVGYSVEVPETLKHGPAVKENIFESDYIEKILMYVDAIMLEQKDNPVSVGIIGMYSEDIEFIKKHLDDVSIEPNSKSKVRVSTIIESQGVEFDIVCIVGIHCGMFRPPHVDQSVITGDTLKNFIEEKKNIHKDLIYIALTRAMTEMHVLGTTNLSDEIKSLI